MLRVVMVAIALAGCGRGTAKPSRVAGTTQATAIAIPLEPDRNDTPPAALNGFLIPATSSHTTRWFVVTLPDSEKRTLSISVGYKGSERSVELALIDPAGRTLPHKTSDTYNRYGSGWRDVRLADAQGTYFIRVTTLEGLERYNLTIRSLPITPPPKIWPPCNPFVYDAENPKCKGIIACDPNKPVASNPACCTHWCIRGECPGVLLSGADSQGFYAWLNVGAENGITVWYSGYASLALLDGTRGTSNIRVVEVERNRSKVFVGKAFDPARLDGNFVRLRLPPQCAQ